MAHFRNFHKPVTLSFHLMRSLARLWADGAEFSWQALHRGQQRRRVALPTYPFQRQRYWVDRPGSDADLPQPAERVGRE